MNDQEQKQKSVMREIREWLLSIAVAFVIAMLFQNYAYAQAKVEQNSMQNTLFEGQRLIEDKISYRFSTPKPGDIVIVHGPESERRLVKRVIGAPGDVINIHDGKVYVNDRELNEPYAKGQTYANGLETPFTVPPHKVFVMGDNREVSMDSRQIGPIDYSSVEGKIIFRIWPLNKVGSID